jgi:hypothetical protein
MALKSEDATEAELDEACRKIGALILSCSQLDISIKKLITAIADLSDNPASHLLIHSVDLSRKRQIIESYCTMFTGSGLPGIDMLAKFAASLKPVIDDRNTAAHGILKHHAGRLCLGSFTAVKHFWNTGKEMREERPSYLAIADMDGKIARCSRLNHEAEMLVVGFKIMHTSADIPELPLAED